MGCELDPCTIQNLIASLSPSTRWVLGAASSVILALVAAVIAGYHRWIRRMGHDVDQIQKKVSVDTHALYERIHSAETEMLQRMDTSAQEQRQQNNVLAKRLDEINSSLLLIVSNTGRTDRIRHPRSYPETGHVDDEGNPDDI